MPRNFLLKCWWVLYFVTVFLIYLANLIGYFTECSAYTSPVFHIFVSHGPLLLGLFILGFYSPHLKKLLEMVSLGWRTDTKYKKHIVRCVLNFCLWNWRLYSPIASIFSGGLQWDSFLPYTWWFSTCRVKTTWIRSGEHGGLQLISSLLLCQQKCSKQCIELSPIWTVARFSKKKVFDSLILGQMIKKWCWNGF
jgi:hypothetical protein